MAGTTRRTLLAGLGVAPLTPVSTLPPGRTLGTPTPRNPRGHTGGYE
jgi:hypothetical protein